MDPAEVLQEISSFLGLLVQKYGPLGIAAAMFAESAGVPFASTVVILTSGSMIFSGKATFWSMLISSTAGIILGSVFSYSVGFLTSIAGKMIKRTYLSRFTHQPVTEKQPRQSRVFALWEKYGSFSVFMGQLWGVTRTFISFPAGAMHMNILLFIVYTALGGALFSLGAIGFSMALTGAMGLLLKLVRLLLGLSPWIWPLLILSAAGSVYLCRRRGWKFSIAALRRWGRERFLRKK